MAWNPGGGIGQAVSYAKKKVNHDLDVAKNPTTESQVAEGAATGGGNLEAHALASTGTRAGTVSGDLARMDLPGATQDAKGGSAARKASAEDQAAQKAQQQYQSGQGYNAQLDTEGQKYLSQMDAAHQDASNTYSNSIRPNLQNLMERAKSDTDNSMTLQQAMDPNNAVASGVRQQYETQAQNEGRQGLQAASTLSSLGMQNMAGQMGSMGPLSGGQLAAMMGQTQGQSAAAFANTQQREQSLRDTGLQQGYAQSQNAYNEGLDAQSRLGATTGNYEAAAGRQRSLDEGNYGLHNAMNDQSILRNQALDTSKLGGDMSSINAQIAQANAQQQSQANMGTAALGAGGTAIGGYFGGAPGAAAGAKAGTAAGKAMDNSPSDDDGEVQDVKPAAAFPVQGAQLTGDDPYAGNNPYSGSIGQRIGKKF